MIPNSIANINAVATWLTTLSVPGLTIRDAHNIPEAVQPQDVPLLAPATDEPFMTGITLKRISFKDSTNGRRFQCDYQLHYTLFGFAANEGVTLFEKYADMLDLYSAAITVFAANDTPTNAWDIRPTGTPHFGLITDIAGTPYHGARLILSVTEFD